MPTVVTNPEYTSDDQGEIEKDRPGGGIFYLLTFVSIPTAVLYAGVRDPNFIAGAGSDNPVIIGAILKSS